MLDPARAIALYGTKEEVPAPRLLRAGKLTAELDAGNLRDTRWNGEEVLRAVSFIVRDKDWRTYNPAISDLAVVEDTSGSSWMPSPLSMCFGTVSLAIAMPKEG